jgi:hypothetical protein
VNGRQRPVRISNNTRSSTQLEEKIDKNLHYAFVIGDIEDE